MNNYNDLLNDEIIPDPFADLISENLTLPMDYKPSLEEKKEALMIFKELMKHSLEKREKGFIGLPEHIIYNYLRGVPLFKGIKKVRPENYNLYKTYSLYYSQGWHSLPISYPAKIYHQKLSKVLGYKYNKIMQRLQEEFYKEFK